MVGRHYADDDVVRLCAAPHSAQNADFLQRRSQWRKNGQPAARQELRQYGQTLRTFGARTMVSSIASRETLEEVREAMRGVVEEGTARRMRSRYYSVGGKTGTAQIAMGRSGLHRPQRAAAIIWALSWAISRKTIPSTVAWSP